LEWNVTNQLKDQKDKEVFSHSTCSFSFSSLDHSHSSTAVAKGGTESTHVTVDTHVDAVPAASEDPDSNPNPDPSLLLSGKKRTRTEATETHVDINIQTGTSTAGEDTEELKVDTDTTGAVTEELKLNPDTAGTVTDTVTDGKANANKNAAESTAGAPEGGMLTSPGKQQQKNQQQNTSMAQQQQQQGGYRPMPGFMGPGVGYSNNMNNNNNNYPPHPMFMARPFSSPQHFPMHAMQQQQQPQQTTPKAEAAKSAPGTGTGTGEKPGSGTGSSETNIKDENAETPASADATTSANTNTNTTPGQQQQQQQPLMLFPGMHMGGMPGMPNQNPNSPGGMMPMQFFPPPGLFMHPHHPHHNHMSRGFPVNMNMMHGQHGMVHPGHQPVRTGISLALACDVEQLSEYQILVRQQLEIFEAGPEDVECNTQGRKKQVILEQAGIRCRHCAAFPLRVRGRGAVYYPAKLEGIYQAAQNMAGSHLCQACQQIPAPLKQQIRKLRERRDNASGGKQYWADGCRALGLYETEEGLRIKPPSPR
jgi:hypothetical protein